MKEENNNENNELENNSYNNTTKSDNYKKAGEIQNELGSKVLQHLGVKNKTLANIAAKNNGGFFSPHNTLANRMLKKSGQKLIANQLDRKDQLNNNGYNPFDRINNGRNNSNDGNSNNQSLGNKITNEVTKKGGSVALQSMGVPKPLADVASDKLLGPIIEKRKKILKIKIMLIVVPIIFLIMFIASSSDSSGDIRSKNVATSDEISNYLYGNGDESQLYKKLIALGLCKSDNECADTEAAKFYIKLKEVISSYDNTTQKIAANFIIELTRYNRGNITKDNIKGRYDTLDEIDYIADIILADGSLTSESIKDYKSKIIEDGGYFETYRQDLLSNASNNSSEVKSQIFDKVVNSVLSIYKELKDKNITFSSTGGNCSYNVNGTNVSNVKVQLLQCNDGNRGQPIDGEEIIDFEKYILGVTYAENSYPEEGAQTEAIAARSYALLRPTKMGNSSGIKLEQKDNYWLLSIRNCTEDQVYCNPDEGCWATGKNTGKTVHSGTKGSETYKPPLAQNAPLRKWISDVNGIVAVDSNGFVVSTNYVNRDQQQWNSYANAGDVYPTIIKKHYGLSVSATCSNIYASGDYSTWKQTDSRWNSIKLGTSSSTIGEAGCLVTSVAIQLAKSGVTTSLSELNPGTVVQALNSNNGFQGASFVWNSITKIAPTFVLENNNYTLSGTKAEKAAELKKLQDSGYYVVIRAIVNQHWVALDHVEGEKIYINDPGSQTTSLWDRYSDDQVTRCAIYKIQ